MAPIVVFWVFTVPAFSDLTENDIEKINEIVKGHIDDAKTEIEKVNIVVTEMDKRLNQIFTLVIALVAFIAVVVGVPQIIAAR